MVHSFSERTSPVGGASFDLDVADAGTVAAAHIILHLLSTHILVIPSQPLLERSLEQRRRLQSLDTPSSSITLSSSPAAWAHCQSRLTAEEPVCQNRRLMDTCKFC